MADEAYRAVFLRVHPTGKMVLSLTTEADGKEPEYAQLVAGELGVPALDVKVVPADADRFGEGHGYNTAPSEGAAAAITKTTEKIRVSVREHAQMLRELAKQIPLGRMATPGDIADAVRFLASDGARHITGQTLFVNGGSYMA